MTATHPAEELKSFRPHNEFFIGFDSDGCVFDTMELKHKECFVPATVNVWNLQGVSRYLRETWEFVNLYSKTRGTNRFPALVRALDMLSERPVMHARGVKVPDLTSLRDWVDRETALGEKALAAEVARTGDPLLARTLAWTREVNANVKHIVRNCPPFRFVREVLASASIKADVMVISQTPVTALSTEWKEHGIDGFPAMIAGQEMGTKAEHLQYAAVEKYDRNRILLIGDAPGDHEAAKRNQALFYPINPGAEEASWERFYNEGLPRFFSGRFSGAYQEELIGEFHSRLPDSPPWKE